MTDAEAGMTIAEAARRSAAGTLSPVAWVAASLRRAEAARHLNAFLHLATEAAGAAAAEAEHELSAGRRRGPLHGAPVAVKDVIDVAGMPCTANSRVFRERTPRSDAAAVRPIRAAGAVIVGKLAAWECAVGGTSFDLPWPPARNPWDPARDPGGSSSGSAVAVASGTCAAALGTDTGGSIREPAAWCGIAGLKPTFGVVGRTGVLPVSASLDHVGPMAWTCQDCALLLDAIAAPRASNGHGAGSFAAGLDAPLDGLRIGVVDLDGEDSLALDDDVDEAVVAAAGMLALAGAKVAAVRIAPLALYSAVVTILAAVESHAVHRRRLAASGHLYDPLTRQRLMSGAGVAEAVYRDALRAKDDLATRCRALMEAVDVLLMPVSATLAPLLGAFDSHAGHPSLARPWNVTGSPALSVCSGFAGCGLPLAVQVVARPFEDRLALRVGHRIETAFATRERRPDLSTRPAGEAPAAAPPSDDATGIARLMDDLDRAAERIAAATASAA